MNENFSDIATNGLSNCLTLDGQSAMTDPIKAANGTEALPSIVFATDLNTGRYRKSANVMADVCDGAEVVEYSVAGIDVTGSITQNGNQICPIGVVLPYAGSSAPAGFLLCYGQSLLRADYADLFTAIGTTYGAADGTHFNVPDLRGRVPAGKDNMGGSAASRLTSATMTPDGNTLGAVGGDEGIALTEAQLPAVTKNIPAQQPTLSYNFRTDLQSGGAVTATINVVDAGGTGGTVTTVADATPGSISFGSDDEHDNVQPTILLNYIIRAL